MPYIAKAKLQELLTAGAGMANACFNLKQLEQDPERRETFRQMQERWDAARAALRTGKDKD